MFVFEYFLGGNINFSESAKTIESSRHRNLCPLVEIRTVSSWGGLSQGKIPKLSVEPEIESRSEPQVYHYLQQDSLRNSHNPTTVTKPIDLVSIAGRGSTMICKHMAKCSRSATSFTSNQNGWLGHVALKLGKGDVHFWIQSIEIVIWHWLIRDTIFHQDFRTCWFPHGFHPKSTFWQEVFYHRSVIKSGISPKQLLMLWRMRFILSTEEILPTSWGW